MPSSHREPLLPHPSAETHPCVVQKRQVCLINLIFFCGTFHISQLSTRTKDLSVWLRYFPLLAKQRPNQPECDVLLNVFALLSAKNASPATIAMVMDIAESLATTEDFVASEEEEELTVNGCVFPQPEEGALITAGSPQKKKILSLVECPSVQVSWR